MRLTDFVNCLFIGALLAIVIGCDSKPNQIIVDNQSGQRLEKVTVLNGGKSFEFGVLIDGGTKGFMTAGRFLGSDETVKLTMSFESVDGKEFNREVKLDSLDQGRLLRLVIDSNLEVTGARE